MPDDWHFSERLDNDRQWPAEGHSSTYAPGQPVPHRPLTHHGGTPPNLIQSAFGLARAGMTNLPTAVAGLPSLASWGWVRVFLAASACCWPQHSIYLNLIHNCRCIRACRQACQGICPRAVRPGFDPQACGGRQAPLAAIRRLAARDEVRCSLAQWLCTLLRCLAHAHDRML